MDLFKIGFNNVGKDEPRTKKSLPSYVYAFAILMLVINAGVGIVQNSPYFGGIFDDTVWITVISIVFSFLLAISFHVVRKHYMKEKEKEIQKISGK